MLSWQNFKSRKLIAKIIAFAKKFTLIGFEKVPLYYVVKFFSQALFSGTLSSRAASVSFSFFLAIFPGIIFLFTLIPFIPIDGFQETLLIELDNILPAGVQEITHDTIVDIINTPREGLSSLNFILALFFATNGIFSLTDEFNNTSLFVEKRNYFKQRLVAFILVIILTILLFSAIALVLFSDMVINALVDNGFITRGTELLAYIANAATIFLLYYFAISFLYYLGPAKRKSWQFFSAGSSFATILLILTSLAFTWYVNNLNNYNKLYGSIGTILIVLLWININSFVLLIGFELNAAIKKARMEGNNLV